MRKTGKHERDIRLLLSIYYEGPWGRLEGLLLGIDPETLKLRWEVRDGGVLSRLADFCETREHAWMEKWVRRWPDRPPVRWQRKNREQLDDPAGPLLP